MNPRTGYCPPGQGRSPIGVAWLQLGRLLCAAGLFVSGSLAAGADETRLADQGRELSKTHCGRCHIVDEDRFAGISSTPSFKIMIVALEDWETRFGTFMVRNPHPAHVRLDADGPRPEDQPAATQEVVLSEEDIEAILAYVDAMAVKLGRK